MNPSMSLARAPAWGRHRTAAPGQFMLELALVLVSLAAPPSRGQEPRDLHHEAYRAQMAAAEATMRLGEHADAKGWLDATEPDRRGFEWRVHAATLDQALATWPVDGGVNAVAVSPDGRAVACGHVDGTLSLHDPETFTVLASVAAHTAAISQVSFDREAGRLVTASHDFTAKVWRASDLAPLATFAGHAHAVGGADFSPDGALVASCSYERPPSGVVGTLHVWNAADAALVRTMEGGRKPLVGVSFAPDGQRIAAGSWDFCVLTWQTSGGEPQMLAMPTEGVYNAVDGVAWSPDGSLLVGASRDHTARVWNRASGAIVASLRGHLDSVAKAAFSPDGSLLATASRDGTLKFWSTTDWSERATLRGHADDVVGLAFSPDGDRLWSCATDGTVGAWDTTTTWYRGTDLRASRAAYVVRFSPDGHRLASCSYDGRVQVWNADTLEPLASFQAHAEDKSCHTLGWSPDGRLLFTGSYDGTVRIWDSVTLEERGRLEHEAGIYWLDVSPDGRRVATVSGSRVFVWDIDARKLMVTFAEHGSSVLCVTFAPDSTTCVSSGRDGKAIVWDATTGAVRFSVTGVGSDVAESVFTPDGEHLIVGGRGGHVTLHRASDGGKVRDLVRNRHGFSHLAVSPDGSRVALGANTVTLIDVRHGDVVGQFRLHGDAPYHVAFDPQGTRLASCSTDRSIAVADTLPLRARLARATAARRRIEAADTALGPTTTASDIRSLADAVFADETLDDTERAARVAALTLRAAGS